MTINATAMWLLALYAAVGRGAGRRRSPEVARSGTTQNDIIKEYLSRGTYVFPPGAVAAADHRHGRLHRRAGAEVEPDQHLQLSPAGGRRDAGAGAGVRDVHRDRGARRGARLRAGARRASSARSSARISFFVNAGVRFVEEMCKMRAFVALWDEITRERYGVTDADAAPVPLRRAGQLARPDRGAAGEQRAAHRAGDARGDAVQGRPRPGGPAAGVERGARAAPAVGPAVVAADPAGAGLRVRPAGVRRPVRRLARGRGQGRRARRRARGPRSTGSRRWAARSPRSRAAT